MKIIRIDFNWFCTNDQDGEDWHRYEVGKKEIVKIEEHRSQGEGDKWFYDVHFSNGKMERIFNPNRVYFEKEEN